MTKIDPKAWLPVFAVSFGSFSSLLSSTTIEVAFPNLMGTLGIELNSAQWTITLYMIVMTIAMLLSADLVKRFGIRKVSGFSFSLFFLSSWLGGVAQDPETLFVARALQGFSAGLQAPLGAIVVINLFPKDRIGAGMGVFGSIMLLAPSLGPVIGGLIVEYHSWRAVFYFQLPMAVISFVLGQALLPKGEVTTSGKYDWFGLITLAVIILMVFYCLNIVSKQGTHVFILQVGVAVIVIGLIVFAQVEKVASNPIIDLNVFKVLPFSLNLVVIFMMGAGMFSSILLIPYYMLKTLNFTPEQVGLALLPAGLVMAVSSPLAGRLSDRIEPPKIIVPSLFIFSLSGFYLSQIQIGTAIWGLAIGAIIGRIGLSFLLPSLYTNTIKSLNGNFTEYGSSLMNFSRQLGGAIGVMYFSSEFSKNSFITAKYIQYETEKVHVLDSARNFLHNADVPLTQLTAIEQDAYYFNNINTDINLMAEHMSFINLFKFIGYASLAGIAIWLLSYYLSTRAFKVEQSDFDNGLKSES